MPSISRFISPYMRVESLKAPLNVTIASVAIEELGEAKEPKPVIYFSEVDQGLVASKVVLKFLVEQTGSEDSDNWIGRKFVLFVDQAVYFSGKRVGGLRLRAVEEPVPAKAKAK